MTHSQSSSEREIVTRLIQAAAEAGVQADPVSVVNFYVALKCKPLAILTGPMQSGKSAVVKSLAQVLTGGDPFRYQVMPGHAWWAGQTGNVALFTEAQTRLNTSKILALMDEAWQPENAQRVFIACLSHISPAELLGFFSELAFQLRHGELMRLPGLHLTAPIPYPSNLLLVGTMDTARFDHWSDADLLSMTAVIPWPAFSLGQASPPSQMTTARNGEVDMVLHRPFARHCRLQPLYSDHSSSVGLSDKIPPHSATALALEGIVLMRLGLYFIFLQVSAIQNFNRLIAFRQAVYQHGLRRARDAQFELTDAQVHLRRWDGLHLRQAPDAALSVIRVESHLERASLPWQKRQGELTPGRVLAGLGGSFARIGR